MLESSPQDSFDTTKEAQPTPENIEKPPHLDVASLMKENNCYFVHTIQVTKNVDVSSNNKSIDTKKLTPADRLDVLYAANPTVSASSLRPDTQDGTFYGGFGVIFSQGEVVSAERSDSGTVAKSLSERVIFGQAKNSKQDVEESINRTHQEGGGKSYNEIVLKSPQVAGGFMKIGGEDMQKRISYQDEIVDYGVGGGEVIKKYGVLKLANEENGPIFDTPFSVLMEMNSRGPVFLLGENNQLLQVSHINPNTREVTFSSRVMTPADIAEVYGDKKLNKYTKQEMLDRLSSRDIKID